MRALKLMHLPPKRRQTADHENGKPLQRMKSVYIHKDVNVRIATPPVVKIASTVKM